MKTVNTADLQNKMKAVLEEADKKQEVLILPSTKARGDFFIVPGQVYNEMTRSSRKHSKMELGSLNGHLERIKKEDSSLLDRLSK
jgi:hypothetical protein